MTDPDTHPADPGLSSAASNGSDAPPAAPAAPTLSATPQVGLATAVRTEELEATRGELFLAFVFGVFLVIGLIWGYAKLDEPFRPAVQVQIEQAQQAQFDLMMRRDEAQVILDNARAQLTQAREAYRTAVDTGRPADEVAPLEASYRSAESAQQFAQSEFDTRQAQWSAATAEVTRLEGADGENLRAQLARSHLYTFLARLVYVLGALALSFFALSRWRNRVGRRAPLLYATVGAATLLAAVMAVDYITDYIHWQDLGPLVLSAVGVLLSLVAFLALQRTIIRRIPARRVRRAECPFCGYPVRLETPGVHQHCEGCGRDVLGTCTWCGSMRRVGAPFCAVCGHA